MVLVHDAFSTCPPTCDHYYALHSWFLIVFIRHTVTIFIRFIRPSGPIMSIMTTEAKERPWGIKSDRVLAILLVVCVPNSDMIDDGQQRAPKAPKQRWNERISSTSTSAKQVLLWLIIKRTKSDLWNPSHCNTCGNPLTLYIAIAHFPYSRKERWQQLWLHVLSLPSLLLD